jgi:predicted TIM-barrel fold metal-dependent hydrolase
VKIIDCHTHPLFEDKELKKFAKEANVNFSFKGLLEELKRNDVERILAISIHDEKNNRIIEELAEKNNFIGPIYFFDVEKMNKKSLRVFEEKIEKFLGVKITPGRQSFYPNEKKCEKIYKIAEKYDKPVIIHSGDPFYPKARIKYSHPIHIDDVAVEHPNLKIVIAHSGNPWIEDTVEIAYKNENVFLDVSGWFFKEISGQYFKIMKERLNFILSYLESCDKILFGTDWPLIKIEKYVDFIKKCELSKSELERIMYKNALKLFWKK